MSASSPTQINPPDKDGSIKSTKDMQDAQLTSDELEGRKRTLTQKGLEYQLPFKKKSYEDALTKLRNCVDTVDMLWIDASDIDKLRQLRTELEESRQAFEIARSGYAPLLSEEELQQLCGESSDLLRRAVQLRTNAGERIFILEKDEINSRTTTRSSSSKRSRSSNASETRARALAEAAKKKVDWQYAKLEMQKKVELKMKECEIEEMQRKKDYERAEAEAAALAKVEEEEEEDKKHIPDCLDDIPCETDKEDRVLQYLSALPITSACTSATSTNHVDHQQNTPVSVVSTTPLTVHPNNSTASTTVAYGTPEVRPSVLRPSATPFSPLYSQTVMPTFSTPLYSAVDPLNITKAITESFEAARMPPPNLTVFTGNPLDWPTWKSAFETVIEKRAINPSEKILYLLQYLAGAPKKVVEGYQFVSSPDAYQTAKGILEKRFGHPSVVADAFRKRLENWQRIAPRDGAALREFADFLQTCKLAMHSVEDLETLNKESGNKKLVKILPAWAHPKWGTMVRDYQLKHGDTKFPPFTVFVNFVTEIAEIQCLPVLSDVEVNKQEREDRNKNRRRGPGHGGRLHVNSLLTDVTDSSATSKKTTSKPCARCRGPHDLNTCQELLGVPLKERLSFLIKKGFCLRCLEHGHMAKENKCTARLKCASCKQQHPTCLHREQQPDKSNETEHASQSASEQLPVPTSEPASAKCTRVCGVEGQESGQDQSLIIPVWVSSSENLENKRLTYALLDCQSNATFITEKLREELGIEGAKSHLLLSTLHEENEVIESHKVKGLTVTSMNHQSSIPLPQAFTRQMIPFKSSQIPKPEVAMYWEHLKPIASELMPYRKDLEVGLLIGTNCPRAIKPREIIPGSDNDPYGVRTDLGWGIIGRVCLSPLADSNEHHGAWTNKIITKELTSSYECSTPRCGSTFVLKSSVKEVFHPAQINQMFELDFQERRDIESERSLSVEDQKFLKIVNDGIHKREDGHYEMPLPLRSAVELPNNRSLAIKRLFLLKERFKRNPGYYKDYARFMEKVIEDCAEKCEDVAAGSAGRVNYVPHHGVYHPKKPGKIRVVFDCSARYAGTSLNQNLLPGPDLTNSLVGVLCRFRQEAIAFSCDVESMFHQFFVNEEDRDLLRFFWWENGDLDAAPVEYRMQVHLFGAGSSPGCANFGFKQAAHDGEEEFGTEAADFLRRNFYVDDGLKSLSTVSATTRLIQNSQAMCAKAGIRLHKFVSNTKEVLKAIPPEDRANGLQDLDLKFDQLPIERTLGVMWCIETDCFRFRIVIQDRPLTRRGVLSTVCSVYDPLGLAAPVILVGKQILQELCRGNVDWDEPIPDNLRPGWERWRNELHVLEELKIPRCFKPKDFGEVKSVQLHHFSDASQSGYGQCSYVRLVNQLDQSHVSFVMGKARVAPLKAITIPRLELTAAVVSTKVSQCLKQELDYQDVVELFWTDSQVVIGYINNEARRFHTFVANRVQEIHNFTKPDQWHYVGTDTNPADAASRGLTSHQLVHDSCWLKGPEFLWSLNVRSVQPCYKPGPLDSQDPEVKKISTLATQTMERFPNHFETSRLSRFSNWFRAKNAVALCLLLKRRLRERKIKESSHVPESKLKPEVEDLAQAEIEIIRSVQHEHFKEEIKTLRSLNVNEEFPSREAVKQRNSSLKKTSCMYRLDPYLDADGILRVGGRLRRADMSESVKHPSILPKKSHITELIIQDCHHAIKHQGSGMTHNELRQRGYWVIGGTSAVGCFISRCTICRRFRAPPQVQKMADLPKDRTESVPPFTYSAVDYFGPFLIKEGRKEVKRYGVLFTCMSSRAVHIETSTTLETDSYINALRRFLAERGPVRQIRSDRGTNFVGAKRELANALSEMDHEKVSNHLLKENCDWIDMEMNVPSASHMGGSWERQIRTVRNVLAVLLQENGTQLDDESFRTLMKEVQNIVNSRPLTVNNMMSPGAPEPLTPNHLLTMKVKVLMPPPGVFLREDLYSNKRWRRVQHLANEFWTRWRREFLHTLQMRQKWAKPQRNLMVGDIVVVKDDHLPRNEWKLAQVQQTLPSDDGFVRKVVLAVGTRLLDNHGRRTHEVQRLERPIHKLVLILPQDREFPIEEPPESDASC